MQNSISFDIIRNSDIDSTFRVSKIMADFDLKKEHSNEHFTGEMRNFFIMSHESKKNLRSKDARLMSGESLGSIII